MCVHIGWKHVKSSMCVMTFLVSCPPLSHQNIQWGPKRISRRQTSSSKQRLCIAPVCPYVHQCPSSEQPHLKNNHDMHTLLGLLCGISFAPCEFSSVLCLLNHRGWTRHGITHSHRTTCVVASNTACSWYSMSCSAGRLIDFNISFSEFVMMLARV